MPFLVLGRIVTIQWVPFHSFLMEIAGARDTYPLRWPDVVIRHYAQAVQEDISARKPYLKGSWLKAERVRVLQELIAKLGWTYEKGFGRKRAEQLVEMAFEHRGKGRPCKTAQQGPYKAIEAQSALSKLSDDQLMKTWNALCEMNQVCLALEEGPFDDTDTMADWMKQIFWEICFRKANGASLQVRLAGGHN